MKIKSYLLEDNPTTRHKLLRILEARGSVQIVGSSGSQVEGLAWLRTHPRGWDLAIVDLFLRQGSGVGVLGACRDRAPLQKMVVLRNYATQAMHARCARLGGMPFSTSQTTTMDWSPIASLSTKSCSVRRYGKFHFLAPDSPIFVRIEYVDDPPPDPDKRRKANAVGGFYFFNRTRPHDFFR